jgi:hypothetical protein
VLRVKREVRDRGHRHASSSVCARRDNWVPARLGAADGLLCGPARRHRGALRQASDRQPGGPARALVSDRRYDDLQDRSQVGVRPHSSRVAGVRRPNVQPRAVDGVRFPGKAITDQLQNAMVGRAFVDPGGGGARVVRRTDAHCQAAGDSGRHETVRRKLRPRVRAALVPARPSAGRGTRRRPSRSIAAALRATSRSAGDSSGAS